MKRQFPDYIQKQIDEANRQQAINELRLKQARRENTGLAVVITFLILFGKRLFN